MKFTRNWLFDHLETDRPLAEILDALPMLGLEVECMVDRAATLAPFVVAEVISVKRDKDNNIIEGSPDKIKFVTDIWKFTKNILKKSPNWYLSEIVSK